MYLWCDIGQKTTSLNYKWYITDQLEAGQTGPVTVHHMPPPMQNRNAKEKEPEGTWVLLHRI